MSSFTNATSFQPIILTKKWKVTNTFSWYLQKNSKLVVKIPEGFIFNGADIPFPFTIGLPRVHTDYIQSACLHDYMLDHLRHIFTRDEIDKVFFNSLKALGNPPLRCWSMYQAVRLWGILNERQNYFDVKSI